MYFILRCCSKYKLYYYKYYHISLIHVNEIITTSALSFDLEKSSVGRNQYCPAGGKRDHATWLRASCDGEGSVINFVRCNQG